MNITYDYYRIFYYVAIYGSFSKAASVLLCGQPNITKAINNLESQLGCKLFVRSNKGVTLTPEGNKLFYHAKIAFENLNKAENEIISEKKLDGGLVSIATTEIGLYGYLLSKLTAFNHDYPNVKIRLLGSNTPQSLNALKNGTVDFAIVTLHEKIDYDFRVSVLRDFEEPLCCKKGYIDDYSGDVFSLPYISVSQNSNTYKFYNNYFISLGISKDPDFEVSAADQVLPLIKAGLGIGFVFRDLANDDLEKGLIEEILLPNPPGKRRICLLEDKKRCISFAANKVIEYLIDTK